MERPLNSCLDTNVVVRRPNLGMIYKWILMSDWVWMKKSICNMSGNSRVFHSSAFLGMCKSTLTHINMKGSAEMVNVMDKPVTERIAVAEAIVDLGDKAFLAVKENQVKKGSVLDVAQIAGIQGAKLTSQLIPLCHNISLTHVDITMELLDHAHSVKIIGSARAASKTGVEMEALTAVTVAALTVYDMCKSVSKQIIIRDVKLLKKMGGQSGDYQ